VNKQWKAKVRHQTAALFPVQKTLYSECCLQSAGAQETAVCRYTRNCSLQVHTKLQSAGAHETAVCRCTRNCSLQVHTKLQSAGAHETAACRCTRNCSLQVHTKLQSAGAHETASATETLSHSHIYYLFFHFTNSVFLSQGVPKCISVLCSASEDSWRHELTVCFSRSEIFLLNLQTDR
jgi:hypothetical protein